MPSRATNEATREEWRALGFFYDRNDETSEWRLVGSRAGLLRFRDLLHAFASAHGDVQSEHEHYGPYMYLKIMTRSKPGFDQQSIHGTLDDFKRLASLVETELRDLEPGCECRIGEEFSSESQYCLVLDLREDEFDPAEADPLLSD